MSAWESPLCLIETGTGGSDLSMNAATVLELEKVPAPLVVVAVAGLYRTGKSYIMNLLANKTKGFSLGSTIQSKTKGIWVWCVDHPTKVGHTLVLLDTEGLGDVEKGDANHDVRLFTLAILLSSTLVYNSKGTIDNDALQKLQFVAEIAEHVKIKSSSDEGEDEDFDRFFPHFIWAVRDFTLKLERDGAPITRDQYLEFALHIKKGNSKKIQDQNRPRQCIRGYFLNRSCFTFPLPCDSELMTQLEDVPFQKLDKPFQEVSQEFKDHIYKTAPNKGMFPKTTQVSGSVFAGLAQSYVDAIKKGAVPCIENAVRQTAETENTKAIDVAGKLYTDKMTLMVSLPTASPDELSQAHETCNKEAVACFLDSAIFDEECKYQNKLMILLAKQYKQWCDKNDAESKTKCEKLLQYVSADLDQKITAGDYMTPGGYKTYSVDLEQAISKYNGTEGKGGKSEDVLHEYQLKMVAQGCSILSADTKLSEEEKKREEEERLRRESEQAQAAAEEARAQAEQRMRDQQKSYEDNLQQLEAKMAEDIKAEREQQEKILSARLEEQQKLLSDGFKEKAEEMQVDISRIKNEQAEMMKWDFTKLGEILKPIAEGVTGAVICAAVPALRAGAVLQAVGNLL